MWTASPYADCDAPVVLSETEPARGAAAHAGGGARPCPARPRSTGRGVARAGRARAAASLPRAAVVAARAGAVPVLAPGRRPGDAAPPARAARRRARRRPVGGDPSARGGGAAAGPGADGSDGGAAAAHRRARPFGRDPRPPGRWVAAGSSRRRSPCSTRPRTTSPPRFLLVAGEPGIGKSRLVSDLGEAALARGMRVLVGRCHEDDYAPALWPWLGVVRALSEGAEVDPLAGAPAGGRGRRHPVGGGHRAADVRRGRRPARGGRPRRLRCCSSSRTSTGPTRPRSSCSGTSRPRGCRCRWPCCCTRRTTEAHDQRRPRGHPRRARPGRRRAAAAGRARRRLGRRAADGVRRRARPPARRVRRRHHGRQPVLRAAVRPPARRRGRPRARRPHHAAGPRRRPRRAAPAGPAAARSRSWAR